MAINLGYAEIVLALILCFLIICQWSLSRNVSVSVRNWPLLGMLPTFLKKEAFSHFHDFTTQLLKQCGHTLMFKGPWFANHDFLMTSDPVNVHHILSKNFVNYPKGSDFNMIFMEAFGEGIFNTEGDSWRLQRKIIHSSLKHCKFQLALEKALHQKMERGLIPVLEDASEKASVIDMQDVFKRFAFDIVCQLELGFDPNGLSVGFPQLASEKAYDVIGKCIFCRHLRPPSIWKLKKWLQVGMEKKYSEALRTFDEFLYKCIVMKRERISIKKTHMEEEEFDLLTAFMEEEKDQDGQMGALKISDNYLRDIALNLLMAGRDTVSAALAWFFWLVARHPSVEKMILDEIKANLHTEKDGEVRLFSVQQLNRLVYLHAALCETLRLYPPVPFNHKAAVQPDVLPSGHHVNQNTRILIFSYPMGRMEEIWGKDCLEFKPERWISERGHIVHVPSCKFLAFNAGPRACSGKDLSFIVMKMVATAVIWNYNIQVEEAHPVKPKSSMILQMKHGLKVRIFNRHVQESI